MGFPCMLTFGVLSTCNFGTPWPRHSLLVINSSRIAIPSLHPAAQLSLSPVTESSIRHVSPSLQSSRNAEVVGGHIRKRCSVQQVENGLFESPSAESPKADVEQARDELSKLAREKGALGRGARALLQALHRRGSFLVRSAQIGRSQSGKGLGDKVYLEFCAAYVRTTAKVTRYAVEQRAWPRIREVLKWEEVSTTEARSRGGRLRRLSQNERYGRHLFLDMSMLAVAVEVAERTLDTLEHEESANDLDEKVEYVINLRRAPIPNRRSVAARCPRGSCHSAGDRTPSLIMWMNESGSSGGALCPVCMQESRDSPETVTNGCHLSGRSLRNLTWRVKYLPGNRAALIAPRTRAPGPSRQERSIDGTEQTVESSAVTCEEMFPLRPSVKAKRKNAIREGKRPVGGHVMKDPRRTRQIGVSLRYAYVVAKLTVMNGVGTMDGGRTGPWTPAPELEEGDYSVENNIVRLRTVGTMSKRSCPQKVMMRSDKQSQGPKTTRRVEEIAWYASQSLMHSRGRLSSSKATSHAKSIPLDDASDWLPTNVVSVSAMKPSSWREILSSDRIVSVPAGWEPSAQAWVLFDLDDVGGLQDEAVVANAGTAMLRVVRRCTEMSGVCMVVQSGPKGMHIWAELREVRSNPRGWFSVSETRVWYSSIGERLLEAARRAGARDGTVDMSSCAAGRFGRRAGWRILPDGTPFRSHVVTVATSRVRNRTPRLK